MKTFNTSHLQFWKIGAGLLAGLTLVGAMTFPVAASPNQDWQSYDWWTHVKSGDRDEDVRTLQYLLKARGFNIAADGIFSGQTKNAVMRFQKAKNLRVDGKVGIQTWTALIGTLKLGSKGDSVRALQNALKTVGKNLGEGGDLVVDGVFGKQTLEAVKHFQDCYGFKQTGIADAQVWAALLEEPHGD